MWLYNICIYFYFGCIALASGWYLKARLWREERRNLFARMSAAIAPGDRVIWIHASSLGEFEQGRPVIESIRKQRPHHKILVTFFSPSGYEIRKNYDGADYIFCIPADTPANVRRFLDAAHPETAIFVKSEFWLNMLAELHRRNIPAHIISAVFRPGSIFFRPCGGPYRRALRNFRSIFVQDKESAELLKKIGITDAVVAGDTRFDRVTEIASQAGKIDVIGRFKGSSRLFIAGSTWAPDEQILLPLINGNRNIKFIVAPHEMDRQRINALCRSIEGGAVCYTECQPETDFSGIQVLVLDTVGLLAPAYGYASWGYIGGGFGVGIHNTLEAAAFGLPVAFGPNYRKFREACDLIAIGAAASVKNFNQLDEWFAPLRDDEKHLLETGTKARRYTESRKGATAAIVGSIFGK